MRALIRGRGVVAFLLVSVGGVGLVAQAQPVPVVSEWGEKLPPPWFDRMEVPNRLEHQESEQPQNWPRTLGGPPDAELSEAIQRFMMEGGALEGEVPPSLVERYRSLDPSSKPPGSLTWEQLLELYGRLSPPDTVEVTFDAHREECISLVITASDRPRQAAYSGSTPTPEGEAELRQLPHVYDCTCASGSERRAFDPTRLREVHTTCPRQ